MTPKDRHIDRLMKRTIEEGRLKILGAATRLTLKQPPGSELVAVVFRYGAHEGESRGGTFAYFSEKGKTPDDILAEIKESGKEPISYFSNLKQPIPEAWEQYLTKIRVNLDF